MEDLQQLKKQASGVWVSVCVYVCVTPMCVYICEEQQLNCSSQNCSKSALITESEAD